MTAPDVDLAFAEACRAAAPGNTWHKWSHRCVYWAATWTGLSDIADRGQEMLADFAREYRRALSCASELTEPPGATPGQRIQMTDSADPGTSGDGFQAYLKAKKECLGGRP